jgi:hypothetical protein
MSKFKEEDFQYDRYYNIAEFHLKITHNPTGLSESANIKTRGSYFRTKNELKLKLIKKILDGNKGNDVG